MALQKKLWIRGTVWAVLWGCLAGTAEAAVPLAVSSLPRVVRQEGITEAAGEIIFTATAAGTTAATAVLTVRLQPAVSITNNRVAPQFPITLTGDVAAVLSISNVSGSALTITVPAGTPFAEGSEFRLRGLRLNVAATDVTFPAAISVQVSAAPAGVFSFQNNLAPVAFPQAALAASGAAATAILPASAPLLECAPNQTPSGSGAVNVVTPGSLPPGATAFRAVATENFAAAFTTAASFLIGDERTATNTTEVTNGTRLLVRVTNLPPGLTLFAPGRVDSTLGGLPATSSTLRLALVKGTDANGAAGTPVTGGEDAVTAFARFTPAADGSALIVYQVAQAAPGLIETAAIPIAVTNAVSPGLGEAMASLALGPLSALDSSSATEPIVRFADRPVRGAALRVISCRTNLLFSWVTNQGGFDAGLAISNTSRDPFNTATQRGSITLHFFGMNAPSSPLVTPVVEAGTTYTAVLSTIAPGFQGYIIAVAGFQFAEGFAFLSNGAGQPGGPTLATSYVPTVLPDVTALGARLPAPGSQ